MLWLGMIIKERGASFNNDVGLPGDNNLKIGLEQLNEYLDDSGAIYSVKIENDPRGGFGGDFGNYLMLAYYRNPMNAIFFNESIVLCAMHSYGLESEWKNGADIESLFKRACFLSDLLKKEEVIQHRIVKDNRPLFDSLIQFMIQKRVLMFKQDDPTKVVLRTSGESQIVLIKSLIFPMIDSYYVTLIYILTFIKNKGINLVNFAKNVQWLAELLFKQGSIQFFESCNQESIRNAMYTFVELGAITKIGSHLQLSDEYQKDETKVVNMLEFINKFRSSAQIDDVLSLNDPKTGLYRKSMLAKFPFMAKL